MLDLVRRIGLRNRLFGGFAVICALLIGMTWVGVQSAREQGRLSEHVGELQVSTRNMMQLKYRVADISNWQVSYAWDAARMGGKAATSPGSPNRRGFEDATAALNRELNAVQRGNLSADETKIFTEVREDFETYLKTDEQAVNLFRQDSVESLRGANGLILGAGYETYSRIQSNVAKMVLSIRNRSTAAQLDARDNAEFSQYVLIAGCVSALLLAIAISLLITRSVVSPVRRVVAGLRTLASRDLAATLPVTGRDEMTEISLAFNGTAEAIREALTGVNGQANALSTSSRRLLDLSEGLDGHATNASAGAGLVTDTAAEISANITTIASAAEEMTVSIGEIAHSTTSASTIATNAMVAVETSSAQVGELAIASAEIGNIVGTITAIAGQTNLLALNASIEAARAGEAGRGFAIVANEVKELAHETERATVDISSKINKIRGTTQLARGAIDQIVQVVQEISEIQLTVASAVEEQSATTAEINRNLSGLATGSQQIATGIAGVAGTASATSLDARQTRQAAREVEEMASSLRELVSSFRY
jgi:methyl-accepting chemotaxis protein